MGRENSKTPKWLVWLLIGFYFFLIYQYITNIQYFGFIDGVNLLMHEAGHLLFSFGGEFITVLGGTLLQLIMPKLFTGYFLLKKDFLGISFGLAWLSTSLFNIATYIADAQEMVLPLVGGDGVGHDWNYLLIQTNLLQVDDQIAWIIRLISWAIIIGAIILALVPFILNNKKIEKAVTLPELNVNFSDSVKSQANLSLPVTSIKRNPNENESEN